MTIEEMHASILLKIDKIGSYSTSNLISGEIDDFINEAQRDYINQYRRLLREYTQIPKGVEAHENLRTLEETDIISSNNINRSNEVENGFVVSLSNLSENYDYYISGQSDFNNYKKSHRIVNKTFINKRSKTLDNQHPIYSDTPVMIDDNTLMGLYGERDSDIPSQIVVDYLREPVDVLLDPNDSFNSVDCELPEDIHRDLVDLAVQNIIRSLSGQQPNQNQQKRQ